MESHLTANLATLSSTLSSISTLHSKADVTNSKSTLQPFTSAILNSYNLDITSFIRDAEQLEENLFWVPPTPGSKDSKDSKNRSDDSKKNNQSVVDDDLGANALMPRNPERRQPVPPTPLRQANTRDGRNVAEQYGARTLLLAAQKLVDNYIPTPRARKHIKQLLRRQSELSSSFSKLDRHAAILEEAISRGGRAPSDHSNPDFNIQASSNAPVRSKAEEDSELKTLREALQKEEMEMMALEEMEKELEREIRKNKSVASSGTSGSKSSADVKKTAASTSSARSSATSRPSVGTRPLASRSSASSSSPSSSSNVKRVSSGSTPTASKSASGSPSATTKARISLKSSTLTSKKSPQDAKPVKASDAASKESSPAIGTSQQEFREGQKSTTAQPTMEDKQEESSTTQEEAEHEEEEEERTVRLAPPEDDQPEENLLDEPIPEELTAKTAVPNDPYASPYTKPIPQATDELERISELIWNTFPEVLRSSSLPNSSNKDSADFVETLAMIDSLANPPASSQTGGDVSMSEDGTVVTTSSTSSTASSTTGPPASPTPGNTIFCLILSYLLRSEEPHQEEFTFLKQLCEVWWEREGRDLFVKAYPPHVREEDVNLNESGTAMATRAVFSMAGKKLAWPRRAKDGTHKVSFGTGLQ